MIKARDNAEAWWLNLKELWAFGYKTIIDRGSYEKAEERLQLPWLSGSIEFPLTDLVPAVPFGIPQPTTHAYIEQYFKTKILGNEKTENEEYTYGERISEQLPNVIEMLMTTPHTNQAVIEVAKPRDILLPDPPCLRCITFKIVNKHECPVLNMTTFWRSWDLAQGFPTNMGGMSLLMEYVSGFLEGVRPGTLYYASDGAHIYSYWINNLKRLLKR